MPVTPVVMNTESNMVVETPDETVTEEPTLTDDSSEVLYKDGRLMANVNGASVLLSAQLNTVDEETAKLFAKQGVHESIPNYQVSNDGNFIYYCEQHTSEDTCINFIYSVNDQVIQYVTVDGVKLVSTAAEAKSATWNGSALTVGTATSISAETPWKLTKAQ